MRRMVILVVSVLAVGLAAAVAVTAAVGRAGPSAADELAAAQRSYPVLIGASAAPLPAELPPADTGAKIAAQGLTRGAHPVALHATDRGELCLSSDGTSTCQDATEAARVGIFVAEVACVAGKETATISGVAPQGVASVEAGGVTVTPDADGRVRLTVPGGKVDGIHLGAGRTSPLTLVGDQCAEAARIVSVGPDGE